MKKALFFLVFFFISTVGYSAPLPANQAFSPEISILDPNTALIHWHIAPGYFLYKDRIYLEKNSKNSDNLSQLGLPRFPQASIKQDKVSHAAIAIYRNDLSVSVPVLTTNDRKELQVNLHFQGCSDEGFCYPPEIRQVKFVFNQAIGLSAATLLPYDETANEDEPPYSDNAETATPQTTLVTTSSPATSSNDNSFEGRLESTMANNYSGLTFLLFFGFGLLLAFTPCVLPMIPVLSGIILGQSTPLSTKRAFLLSGSYVLSMAVTYAAIGAVVTFFGSNLQIMMQSTWAIITLSLLFVGLALSMFGYYELTMPQAWQSKLAGIQSKQHRGNYLGAAIMGALSTLILSPCVTAPLVGALSYIAQTGQVLFGTITLFFLGLGMGTPLLIIGTSAGKWLPKAGPWMNKIKTFFGVLLLAVAIYLLSRLLSTAVVAILWAGLFIFTATLLWKSATEKKWQYVFPALFFIYGSLILVETNLAGHPTRSPLLAPAERVLYALIGNTPSPSPLIEAKTVTTLQDLETHLTQSKGKLIMVDFYADWCTSCQVMESTTFRDPALGTAMRNLVVLKVDLTSNKQAKTLLKKFQVVAPPTFVFLDQKGRECKQLRLVGEHSAPQFLKHVDELVDLTS